MKLRPAAPPISAPSLPICLPAYKAYVENGMPMRSSNLEETAVLQSITIKRSVSKDQQF
jgi:hypothetical protein